MSLFSFKEGGLTGPPLSATVFAPLTLEQKMTHKPFDSFRTDELLAEAGSHIKRMHEFRQNGAHDEELVSLKVALAHLEEALAPAAELQKFCRDELIKGMRSYGEAGSRFVEATVDLANQKLLSADHARKFGDGFFAGRRGEAISVGDRAYLVGYRYGQAVRKES